MKFKFKNNIILILLIVGGIFNDFVLRALTMGITFYWKPIIASIPMIIFSSILGLFLSYKNRNRIYVFVSTSFSIITALNYLYFKHYSSFLSLSLVKQFKQLKELGSSISSTLDIRVLIFLLPTIVMIMVIRKLKKENFFEKAEASRTSIGAFGPLVIGTVLLAFVFKTLTSTDLSRLAKQWNRPYIVEQLGIYTYTAADFIKIAFTPKITTLPEIEVSNILEELVEENTSTIIDNQYKDIFKGRDVYVIHYESAQTFAMNKSFEDGPVTPFLDKMASEGLYFNNFYPQHSVGTSSDSEFTFNTSLLPINNGTVFITHSDREYETFEKLLKKENYYTMSMHGNNGDFWNRSVMHKTLGYDRFFSKEDYIIDEEVGLGLSDKSFFKQSIEKIKAIKEEKDSPIMATLITLSNHYPFDDLETYGDFNVGHLEETSIGNYLKSYNYADKALQSFVEEMDEEGLLENAVIVLYGDHHAKISKDDYSKFHNYNEEEDRYYTKEDEEFVAIDGLFAKELKRTPFIIWSKDGKVNETIDTPMGMVDALPTLGNMLGIFNPYQLGIDIMSAEDNTVIFPDGDWLNKDSYFAVSTSKYYSFNKEEVIENPDLIGANKNIEERIQLSNNIIQNNLIQLFNGLLAQNQRIKMLIDNNIS